MSEGAPYGRSEEDANLLRANRLAPSPELERRILAALLRLEDLATEGVARLRAVEALLLEQRATHAAPAAPEPPPKARKP